MLQAQEATAPAATAAKAPVSAPAASMAATMAATSTRLSITQPGTYSGISGAGEPVKGDGLGGWRSGNDGVRYKGPNPKPGWQLDWDAKETSTDKVIELGLLPPIKPLLELHLRDTSICLGGDGNYYMTGSSGDNIWDKNDGVELWRSTDLKKWDYVGLVWSFAKDATWEKGADYVWAPEIHYLKSKKTYCIALCVATYGGKGVSGAGILISSTGKPEGPYINPFKPDPAKPDARVTGGIDATVFEDDDGKIYYTNGHGDTIYQMKDDLSGFVDGAHHIQLDAASQQAAQAIGVSSGVGSEGASLFKRNGKYYLGAAQFIGGVNRQTGKNGRYSSCVAISDNIYGPYTLYEEAVPCGAGGNYFQDKTGQWFCTYFGNDEASPFREKPGMVAIDFQPNGQIKIADEQPAFILRDGTPTQWRTAQAKPTVDANAAAKTLIDYFLPTPILGKTLSKDAWGAPGIIPRDPQNGLEDTTIKQYNYWDGQIIKGPDGKYHLFASRWDAVKGHNGGWQGSVAVQAVSDNLYGPYVEKGVLWPENQGGKGHNVTALVMPDGTYAVVVSETRPGDVFTSKSLDGPWTQIGSLKVDIPNWRASNVDVMVRPDGDFEIVSRGGQLLLSKAKDGILGPYEPQGKPIYPGTGLTQRNLEDPVMWYSGGLYHIVVNDWSGRKAYHITSKDGFTDWKLQGLAYDPTTDFVRYTDGTVNHWNNMERPGVYIENGHVAAFTFACIDVPKNSDRTNDGHGSKVIVVPFDGAALDRDLQNAPAPMPPTAAPVTAPAATSATPAPARGNNGTLDARGAWNPTPMYTTHPEAFSGLSGPGHAVVGDGYGGYRTGKDGTMYKGLDPAKLGWLDFGNRANGTAVKNGILPPLRPIWELHLRDTTICLGGDGNYYMTGSTGDNIWDRVDGVELWRSKDLQHWDYLGLVWSMAKDATWQKKYRYIWAPEIVYLKKLNTYCIALGWGPAGPTGILKSTTGKPEGPYVNPLANDATASDNRIDAAMFEDDDGTVYFTDGSGGTIRKMKPDLSGFAGDAIQVKYSDGSHANGGPGHEGASLFKANGKYYIGAASTVDGRYSSVDAVADKIEGPYRNWEEAVPCGAGGNFFQDKEGNWWCTYFGNDDQSPWREKPGIVKIEFDEKGNIHIAKKQPDFVLIESARGGKSPWSAGDKPSATPATPAATTAPAAPSAAPASTSSAPPSSHP